MVSLVGQVAVLTPDAIVFKFEGNLVVLSLDAFLEEKHKLYYLTAVQSVSKNRLNEWNVYRMTINYWGLKKFIENLFGRLKKELQNKV